MGYSPRGHEESDTTQGLNKSRVYMFIPNIFPQGAFALCCIQQSRKGLHRLSPEPQTNQMRVTQDNVQRPELITGS